MKKFIICTSINKPTLAIKKFDNMKDWQLVVVGDKKTPKNYKLKNGIYLSPKKQEKIDKKLSDPIWKEVRRRVLNYKPFLNVDCSKYKQVILTVIRTKL